MLKVYDQFVDILLIVGAEVIGNQHQPSGSNQSGVHVLVNRVQSVFANSNLKELACHLN